MKKTVVAICFFILLVLSDTACYGETQKTLAADENVIRFLNEATGKMGLMNLENEVLLPAEYDEIGAFDEYDVAIVVKDQKKGLVDRQGNILLDVAFDRIQIRSINSFPPSNYFGCYSVELNHQVGIYLKAENEIVWQDGWQSYGNEAHYYTGNFMAVYREDINRCNLLTRSGQYLFERWIDGRIQMTHDGGAIIIDDENRILEYIDETGMVQLSIPDYSESAYEIGDYIIIQEKKNGELLWGLVEKSTGRQICEPQYQYISREGFSDGLMMIQMDDLCGYMNERGVVVIPPQFDFAENFSCGRARVRVGNDYGFIDTEGHYIIQPTNRNEMWFQPHYKNHYLLFANSEQEWGFIDEAGNRTSLFPAFSQGDFNASYGSLSGTVTTYFDTQTQQTGYVNVYGEVVIEPSWDIGSRFESGFAIVMKDESYGLIDESGREVTDICYILIEKVITHNQCATMVVRQRYDDDYYQVNFQGDVIAKYLWNIVDGRR